MRNEKSYLKSLLAGESRAYGFTIAFWGSGAILINAHGVPGVYQALTYGLGAVTGFGILTVAAFGQTYREVEYERPSYLVLGMIHYLASLLPIVLSHLVVKSQLPVLAHFFLAGLTVSTTYNILAVLEEDIVERLKQITPG